MTTQSQGRWVRPAGSTAGDGWQTRIEPDGADWHHTGLLVADLAAGESRELDTDDREYLVVPLSGGCTVSVDALEWTLQGRADVFAGATDIVYAPPGSRVRMTADKPARIAVPFAVVPAGRAVPEPHRIDADDVPVEMRGTGVASREVRNFGTPATLQAASIIACEVLTPAGNWSSWPPHKHDEHLPGVESELEEIYYYELAAVDGAPQSAAAIGYQRVYGTDDRPFDVLAEIRTGDVVLIPHGWHGPSTAPPGYDLYYLNVMAGPGPERAWLITDDPAHGWVRSRWEHETVDPRLPFGGTR
ncbi:5-deoxy-glucuronate isomerase [Nakamurella sp. A5-74]|uniref:5-deoxy-glucuronate isomerase n=1 Tax=Nakamurella sp. A5-74 TaxID=3158264 RepID=A0AAU8DTK2_9ACTN